MDNSFDEGISESRWFGWRVTTAKTSNREKYREIAGTRQNHRIMPKIRKIRSQAGN
jgi:hypothetical protein